MRDMQVNSDSSRSKPSERKWRTLVCFAAILLIHVNSSLAVGDAPTRLEFFDSKVEPLLRKRCFSCHSHAAGKAKGGSFLIRASVGRKAVDLGLQLFLVMWKTVC